MSTILENDLFGQRESLEKFLKQADCPLSAYSFVNVFAWQDFFTFRFDLVDDCLCVFAASEVGEFMYLPPLGEAVPAAVFSKCFAAMRERNGTVGVSRIENISDGTSPRFSGRDYDVYLKGREYLYFRKDIARLSGNAYKSQRAEVNHFRKNNTWRVRAYEDAMREDCLALYDRWAQQRRETNRGDIYGYLLDENRVVHRRLLSFHRALGLVGRVVEVEGRIQAYTFGYPLTDQVFCVLLETADLCVKGLAAFVFQAFCADQELAPYPFINAMDDFEMENLKRTKMSFHPAILWPAYTVSMRS